MPYTTTDLLADVRRSGMLPTNTSTGTANADLLAHANKELQGRVVPLVLSTREEFYVRSSSSSLVADRSSYRIPSRAIGGKLRDVELVLSDGTVRNLPRIPPEDAPAFGSAKATYPSAFYMERDAVVLVPTPSTSAAATLRMKYFGRPGTLVATGYTISAIDSAQNKVTVTNGAGIFSTFSVVDIISASSAFDCLAIDQTPLTAVISGVDVVLGFSSLPTGLALGDYVANATESALPQIPAELHGYLAQRTLCRVLQALGDTEALRAAEADAEQMRKDALLLLSNRVEGEPKKVVGGLLWRRKPNWGLL